jgi:hypothetical protein
MFPRSITVHEEFGVAFATLAIALLKAVANSYTAPMLVLSPALEGQYR